MSRPHGEDGTVLVLVLGLFAVMLLLVGVVVNVSVVVLTKRSLASAADGAAVSGAQALDDAGFYADGLDGAVPLSTGAVQQRVASYLAATDSAQPGTAMSASVEDGRTAVVVATRTVGLPFGGWVGVQDVELSAIASAEAPLVAP